MLHARKHQSFKNIAVIANSLTAKVLYRLDYANSIVIALGLGRNDALYVLGLDDRYRLF